MSQQDAVGGSSCLKPACLEASLQQSLRSLKVDTVGAGPPFALMASCLFCGALCIVLCLLGCAVPACKLAMQVLFVESCVSLWRELVALAC